MRDSIIPYLNKMDRPPIQLDYPYVSLSAYELDTPLGQMLAIADEEALYLLEFADKTDLAHRVERLLFQTKAAIIPGTNQLITSLKAELQAYFNGSLQHFKTPVHLLGSPFQKLVWKGLMGIPYSQTRSYLEQAQAIGQQTAYRAVANANGANQIAIVIPCHRIINSNGNWGGYGGGITRKKWLIDHEKQYQSSYHTTNTIGPA